MNGLHDQTVTFEEILLGKEKRAQLQADLRRRYRETVVSITVNMPGSTKYTVETADLIYYALEKLRKRIRTENFVLLEERIYHGLTGPAAVLAVEGDAAVIKAFGVSMEEETPFGRMLDIDVFDTEGHQNSRALLEWKERKCMVCSEAAIVCIRSGAHQQDVLLSEVKKKIIHFKAEQTNMWPDPVLSIGKVALESMLMEAACSPAPGLVDRFHSGAHLDMDFHTFLVSSSAINTGMYRCAMAGWQHEGQPEELLPILRQIGMEAEKAMLSATKGVNTQKGMLFLMGILSAAAPLAIRKQPDCLPSDAVPVEAAAIGKGLVQRELSVLKSNLPERKLTAGERLYLEYGITGIRGEIESGLPSIHMKGLPCFREALREGLSVNDALVHALIGLMSETQDTTILNRHDIDTLAAVQAEAHSIMVDGGMLTTPGRTRIQELDEKYSKKMISPGGSADLLAATYFLHAMDELTQ